MRFPNYRYPVVILFRLLTLRSVVSGTIPSSSPWRWGTFKAPFPLQSFSDQCEPDGLVGLVAEYRKVFLYMSPSLFFPRLPSDLSVIASAYASRKGLPFFSSQSPGTSRLPPLADSGSPFNTKFSDLDLRLFLLTFNSSFSVSRVSEPGSRDGFFPPFSFICLFEKSPFTRSECDFLRLAFTGMPIRVKTNG